MVGETLRAHQKSIRETAGNGREIGPGKGNNEQPRGSPSLRFGLAHGLMAFVRDRSAVTAEKQGLKASFFGQCGGSRIKEVALPSHTFSFFSLSCFAKVKGQK